MKSFVVKLSLSEPNLSFFVIRDGLFSTRSSTERIFQLPVYVTFIASIKVISFSMKLKIFVSSREVKNLSGEQCALKQIYLIANSPFPSQS